MTDNKSQMKWSSCNMSNLIKLQKFKTELEENELFKEEGFNLTPQDIVTILKGIKEGIDILETQGRNPGHAPKLRTQ